MLFGQRTHTQTPDGANVNLLGATPYVIPDHGGWSIHLIRVAGAMSQSSSIVQPLGGPLGGIRTHKPKAAHFECAVFADFTTRGSD